MMPSVTPKSELLSVAARLVLAASPASSPIRIRRGYLSIRFLRFGGAQRRWPDACAQVSVDNPLSYLERRRPTKVADISIVARVAYLAMGPTDWEYPFQRAGSSRIRITRGNKSNACARTDRCLGSLKV